MRTGARKTQAKTGGGGGAEAADEELDALVAGAEAGVVD